MDSKTKWIIALTVGLFLLVPAGRSISQETEVVRLGLSPLIYELDADPGEQFRKEIRLTNGSEHTLVMRGAAEDFVAGGEEGQPQIVKEAGPGDNRWSLKKWVGFENQEFTIGPGETRTFEFDLRIPDNAEPGGHYGIVRFETLPPEAGGEAGVGLVGSVGTLVLLNVSGDVRETGRIISLSAIDDAKKKSPKRVRFFSKGPVDLLARFENTGTVHYKPRGRSQ